MILNMILTLIIIISNDPDHLQTWNLSKILHCRIFRLKILHHQFLIISTVLVRKSTKNEWKWRNLHRWQKFTLPPALTALTNSTSDLHFHIADADGLCDISYVIFCCNVYVTIVEGDLKELSRSLVCILLSIAQIAVNRQQFSPLLYIFPHS